MSEKVRAFIAIKPPGDWETDLTILQKKLKKVLESGSKIRWVKPEQIHLTLRFLGSITRDEVDLVSDILNRVASDHPGFDMHFTAVGSFPQGRPPRVIWAGVRNSDGVLDALFKNIRDATANLGQPPEDRDFHPHLTLARVENIHPKSKQWIQSLFEEISRSSFSPWIAQEIILFKSHLSAIGPTYEKVHAARLKNMGRLPG